MSNGYAQNNKPRAGCDTGPGDSTRHADIITQAPYPCNIEEIARALGCGKERPTSSGWSTLCPAHDDHNPSLHLSTGEGGKLLVHCHAGCSQRDVLDAIRDKGLPGNAALFTTTSRSSTKSNAKLAANIWGKAIPDDPRILTYLRGRGITLDDVPSALRWGEHKNKQMIVAAVTSPSDTDVVAVHRTYLDSRLQRKERKMLGRHKGRGVWLANPAKCMLIGEGIETTLAVMAATGLPGVAALSASGMKAILLPEEVREVVILVDEDENRAGQEAAIAFAGRLEGEGIEVQLVTPTENTFSDNPGKIDFNDLEPEAIRERFSHPVLLEDAKKDICPAEEKERPISLFDEDGKPKTKATILIEIGSQHELFHDETGSGYATIAVNGHRETWPINSRPFSEMLADKYFQLSGKGVSRNIVADATDTLKAMARVNGKVHKIFRRVAFLDGKIYIDLCDKDWRVVEISCEGWQILNRSPVKFLRSPSSLALPIPESGGTLEALWALLNIQESDRPLIAGFLARALSPTPPYFVLCVVGEQGTGKSVFTAILRTFCDPSTAMLRPPPRDERDFLAGAINNWCIAYDNMSGIKPWLSDSLCRVSTGGSFAARTLYSTTDETTIPLARPAILNGIDDLTSRPDLADRAIAVNLQPISDNRRIEERELYKSLDSAKGAVFGTLLNGLCSALRNVDSVKLTHRARMIDAITWATAAEEGLKLPPGSFKRAYAKNQEDMVLTSLESSPFISALLDMVREKRHWSGSPADLLRMLPHYARDEGAIKSKVWPKTPGWTGRTLRRHAPALRKIGLEVDLSRESAGRRITLSLGGQAGGIEADSAQSDPDQGKTDTFTGEF